MNVFITGGTTGIGLALATLYLTEGHRVGLCGRNLSKLPTALREQYATLYPYQVDVTDRKALKQAVRDFAANQGLDLMIANAGRSHGVKSRIPNFEVSIDVIQVNVLGVVHAFEAALEFMLPQKGGHLAAVASVAGFLGLPGAGAYCASKAAVITLCESLTLDLKPEGIDVTTICPGFIDTPLTRQNTHAMPFLLSADEGARRIKQALDQRKVLYIFPLPMRIIVLLLKTMPRWLYRMIMRPISSR